MSSKKPVVPAFTQDDVPGGACCVAESTFATLFPSYLENYIVGIWDAVEAVLAQHQLKGKLDRVEGSLTVSTTKKTWDPYAIIKGRDFMKLIARNVPVSQAQKIFEDEMNSDIIKIGLAAHNVKRFVKRRDRLIGPEGQTLKALEVLTDCYVLVQGKTVAVMGPHRGCLQVRKIVEDCMRNIHPIYGLKQLLIRRELMKRDELKNEDWSRFMPVYKKSTVNKEKAKKMSKKRKEIRKQKIAAEEAKKTKSPFPPAPPKRKEDIAMESGQVITQESYRDRKRKREIAQLELQRSERSGSSGKPRGEKRKAPPA